MLSSCNSKGGNNLNGGDFFFTLDAIFPTPTTNKRTDDDLERCQPQTAEVNLNTETEVPVIKTENDIPIKYVESGAEGRCDIKPEPIDDEALPADFVDSMVSPTLIKPIDDEVLPTDFEDSLELFSLLKPMNDEVPTPDPQGSNALASMRVLPSDLASELESELPTEIVKVESSVFEDPKLMHLPKIMIEDFMKSSRAPNRSNMNQKFQMVNRPTGKEETASIPASQVTQVIFGTSLECYRCKKTFQEVAECKRHMSCCDTELNHQLALEQSLPNPINPKPPLTRVRIVKISDERGKWYQHNRAGGGIPYECLWPDCGRTFTQRPHVLYHIRRHTGEKPFPCLFPNCGKSFIAKNCLTQHNRTHTGEKPFICSEPTCGKKFNDKGNLVKHIRTHTDDPKRSFACVFPHCDMKFTGRGKLMLHSQTHIGEGSYVCRFLHCNQRFSEKNRFVKHKRAHTGSRPYICTFPKCLMKFSTVEQLQEHTAAYGDHAFAPVVYKCIFPMCNQQFDDRTHFIAHKRTHPIYQAKWNSTQEMRQMMNSMAASR